MSPRHGIQKHDLPRVLVWFQALRHERLQLFREAVGVGLGDHESVGLGEALLIHDADDGHLPNRFVLQQAVLHLLRREPLATDLQHVIAPARIGEVAVRITAQHVARDEPFTPEGVARLLVLLPVAVSQGVPAYPQYADLTGGHLVTVIVAQLHLEAGDHRAQGPGPGCSRAIGQEDVPHLGGPQTVEQLDAELLVPAAIEFGGQRFAGGCDETERRQVERPPPSRRGRQHVIDHGGDVDQDGGPELFDPADQRLRGAPLGEQADGRADGKWEQQVRPGGVAEIQLGDRQSHIVRRVLDHLLGIALGGIRERRVCLDDGLGAPRGTAREEPDGRIVPMAGERLEGFGRRIERLPEIR